MAFSSFSLAEAVEAQIWRRTGKPCLALGPNSGASADDFSGQHVRPAVWDVERAAALRGARPVLSVDTGMQRFSCPPEQIDAVLAAGACDEAFTHATRVEHVDRLRALVGHRGLKLHAAGSSLLNEPTAWLDTVRPGLALYRGAARVSTPLVDARKSTGPAGYSGFVTARHGVILVGYAHGLRPGPCVINNRRGRIVEVGMQSAFVEIAEQDRVGDEVVLLGDEITEMEIAADWKTSRMKCLPGCAGRASESGTVEIETGRVDLAQPFNIFCKFNAQRTHRHPWERQSPDWLF